MKVILVLASLMAVFVCAAAAAKSPATPNLMPYPAKLEARAGQLVVDNNFRVAITGKDDPRVRGAAERMVETLARKTGLLLKSEPGDTASAKLVLRAASGGEKVQKLGEDESYRLEITPSGAKLEAPNPLGILRGLETFLQLVQVSPNGFAAPAVLIEDRPRFAWRGLLIDVCRHFMPIDVLKRNIDGMAAVKMNVLHWHLSEDQGFRVESRKYPKLQQMGSDGLFYTQEQVRDVIQYARERGIRVVPEFDMPGHSTAWFVGYPELASAPGPYQIERNWGVHDPAMDPTREETYKFLDRFIGEMAKLFPDQYFHIGGDEVNGKQWKANAKIQQFMQAHGMKDQHDLQAYFNQRVQAIVRKHGKIMVGWDEILHPQLPKDVVVQSWRGQKSLAEAARQGYRGLLSFGYYLDLMQPAAQHYAVDPLANDAANLNEEGRARILGGEACMWAEWVSPENVDSRIWPRNAAVAERLWSPADVRDVDSMYRRLEAVSRELEWRGLTHRSSYPLMLERLAGPGPVEPLRTLADVLEPVKQYRRKYRNDQLTPLNRLSDAVRPESRAARQFAGRVDRLLASHSEEERNAVRATLERWRDNNARVLPILQQAWLMQDVPPLSQDLTAVAVAGLQAIEYLQSGVPAPDSWRQAQIAFLEQARKPRADMLIMIVPAVRKLVEATGQSQAATQPASAAH